MNFPHETRRGIAVLAAGRKMKAVGVVALLIGLTAACARQDAPVFHYDEEGQRILVKRQPLNLSVDRENRIDRVAYLPGESLDPRTFSEEQRLVAQRFGHPEHVRKSFESTRGDVVEEWIYRRSDYLVQWVGGYKAYEGEVTDMEQTLLTWGYPKFAFVSNDEKFVNRQTWIYDEGGSRNVFSFSNGELVGKEGAL